MSYTVTPRPRRARRRRRWPWVLAGIFVLLGVIGAVSGGGDTNTAPDPVDPSTVVAASSAARSVVRPPPASHTAVARSPAAKPAAKTNTPTHTVSTRPRTSSAPAPVAPPATTAAPAVGCYPRSAAGNCVKPGQKCSNADHDMTGVDASGDRIVCRDNNGWRWEPV